MRFVFAVLVIMMTTHAVAADDQYLSYDEFIRMVESGNIKSVSLDQFSSINGTMVDGNKTISFQSFADTGSANDPLLIRLLNKHGVLVSMQDVSKPNHTMPMITGLLFIIAPIIFLVLLIVIIMKLNRILANQHSNQPSVFCG